MGFPLLGLVKINTELSASAVSRRVGKFTNCQIYQLANKH